MELTTEAIMLATWREFGPLLVVGNAEPKAFAPDPTEPWNTLEPVQVATNGPIIRFNRFDKNHLQWQDQCTLWVVNCWDDVPPDWCDAQPLTVYTRNECADVRQPWWEARPDTIFPATSWADRARQIKKHPSTGLITLVMLTWIGVHMSITGFDGLTTGTHTHPCEDSVLADLLNHVLRAKEHYDGAR